MHDIKSIALNLEVTVQTVYNHLKKKNKELKGHTFKNKGATYIDEEGLMIIKKSMGLIQSPVIEENDIGINDVIEQIKIGIVEELNLKMIEREKRLQEQYEEKLDELKNELIIKQQEQEQKIRGQIKIENAKLQAYIEKQREEEKKGFWNRFFRR